jgi:hypothetical protein
LRRAGREKRVVSASDGLLESVAPAYQITPETAGFSDVPQYVGRENLLNLVARDCGVALVLASTAAGVPRSDIAFLRLYGTWEKIEFSIVWSAMSKNPARQKLIDIARKSTQ